jgi:hypothetical protein
VNFHRGRKLPSFQYTPIFKKEPPKDLRERMRVPRQPDRHKSKRSVFYWLLLIAAVLLLFQYLFPGSIHGLFFEDVQIEFSDQLQLVVPSDSLKEFSLEP